MSLRSKALRKTISPPTSPSKIRRAPRRSFTQSQGSGQKTADSKTYYLRDGDGDGDGARDDPRGYKPRSAWTLSAAGALGVTVGAYITNAVYVYDHFKRTHQLPAESTEPNTAQLAIEATKESKTVQPVTEALSKKSKEEVDEVLCFVIGHGIDASHEEFEAGQVVQLSDPKDGSTPVLQESTFRMPRDLPEDAVTKTWLIHETRVASIIGGKTCGVDPGTKLVDVRANLMTDKKTGDPITETEEGGVLGCWQRVNSFMDANPNTLAVINYSYGTDDLSNVAFSGGDREALVSREQWQYPTKVERWDGSEEIDIIIEALYRRGVLVIAAVGNEGVPAHTTWPSSNSRVVSVGATDKEGNHYAINNLGADCALYAPTLDIRTADMPPDQYINRRGTSYAAPFIAGCVTQILRKAKLDEQVWVPYPEVRAGAQRSILESAFDKKQMRIQPAPNVLARVFDNDDESEEDEEEEGKDKDEHSNKEKVGEGVNTKSRSG